MNNLFYCNICAASVSCSVLHFTGLLSRDLLFAFFPLVSVTRFPLCVSLSQSSTFFLSGHHHIVLCFCPVLSRQSSVFLWLCTVCFSSASELLAARLANVSCPPQFVLCFTSCVCVSVSSNMTPVHSAKLSWATYYIRDFVPVVIPLEKKNYVWNWTD